MTSTKKKKTYVKEKTRIAMRSNGPQKQVKDAREKKERRTWVEPSKRAGYSKMNA
jgi:hypothetical protein